MMRQETMQRYVTARQREQEAHRERLDLAREITTLWEIERGLRLPDGGTVARRLKATAVSEGTAMVFVYGGLDDPLGAGVGAIVAGRDPALLGYRVGPRGNVSPVPVRLYPSEWSVVDA